MSNRIREFLLITCCVCLFFMSFLARPLLAGDAAVPSPDLLAGMPPAEAKQTLQWALNWGRQLLPESYQNLKGWGGQKRIYRGFDIKTDGGKITTKRKWKEVNHGRWFRYDVVLGDVQDPNRLTIQVKRASLEPDGRLHFEAQVDVLADVSLQRQLWNYGVRLFSLSADARARLRLIVAGDVAFEFDLTRVPPDILADPHIALANVSLIDLEVDRISRVGGDVAEEIGELIEKFIRDEYLPGQQAKLTQKLNRQIDRQREKLRLGASEWLSRRLSTPAPPTPGPPEVGGAVNNAP
jgi:hypothetical protein